MKMALPSPPLVRYPVQALEDFEIVEEALVRQGSDTGVAYGTPHPRSPEHVLVWQEPKLTSDGQFLMRRLYRKLPGEALPGELVRETTWGESASVVVQDVPTGTPADSGLNVIESVVEPKDAQIARKRTVSVEWPTLVSRGVEAETRTPLTTTRQIVETGSALPVASPLVIEQEIKALDKFRSLQTVSVLDQMPASYVEYRHLRFKFPGLFYDFTPGSSGFVNRRAAFSEIVSARVTVSFSAGATEPAIRQFQPVSWSYPGGFHGASLLTNGEEVTYTVSTSQLTLTVPQSIPSRSQYEALIGQYIAVLATCQHWKGGIWRTELWEVKAQ